MENQKTILEINSHFMEAVFDKKGELEKEELISLEQQMVNHSNNVLGIKVMSVALPNKYALKAKNDVDVLNWLKNKVQSKYSIYYKN